MAATSSKPLVTSHAEIPKLIQKQDYTSTATIAALQGPHLRPETMEDLSVNDSKNMHRALFKT